MADPEPVPEPPGRPLALVGLALTGLLAAGLLGALTNAVNGRVSPAYFVAVLNWRGVADVWRASVAQGIFEGLLFGALLGTAFAVGTGLITRATCPYRFAAGHLLGVVAGALACWALGGLAALGLAALSPDFYRRTFVGVPDGTAPMLAYAWVGGSIVGLQLGGFVSTALGLVVLRGNWGRAHRRPTPPA